MTLPTWPPAVLMTGWVLADKVGVGQRVGVGDFEEGVLCFSEPPGRQHDVAELEENYRRNSDTMGL